MKQQLPPWILVTISSIVSPLVLLALLAGFNAWAEDSELDAGPRAIPYNGILEFNGEAFTGPSDILFTLTDDDGCDFPEAHEDVQVFAGRFSVNIGSVAGNLPTCLFDAERVFLQMAVRGGNEETDHVPLAGRQRINPVPFAYWAAEGSDFKVDGDARIGGDATVSGHLSLPNTTGTDAQIRFSNQFDSDADLGEYSDFKLLLHDTGTTDTSYGLGIQGGSLFFNSDQHLRLKVDGVDKLHIDGENDTAAFSTALSVTGNVSAPSLTDLTSINAGGLAFSTGGNLTVGGNHTVNGTFSGSTGNLGILSVNGADISFANTPGRGDGGRAFVHDSGDTLAINYVGDFAGGTAIHGNFSADANTWGASTTVTMPAPVAFQTKSAGCPNGYYMTGINIAFNGTCEGRCNADGPMPNGYSIVCHKL